VRRKSTDLLQAQGCNRHAPNLRRTRDRHRRKNERVWIKSMHTGLIMDIAAYHYNRTRQSSELAQHSWLVKRAPTYLLKERDDGLNGCLSETRYWKYIGCWVHYAHSSTNQACNLRGASHLKHPATIRVGHLHSIH